MYLDALGVSKYGGDKFRQIPVRADRHFILSRTGDGENNVCFCRVPRGTETKKYKL